MPLLTLQDAAYHCTAALFYLSASVLEALATIQMHNGFTYKQYHENISAVVSPTHPRAHGSRLPDRSGRRLPGTSPLPIFLAH